MITTIVEALICLALLAITIHSFLKVVGGLNGAKGFDNYIINFFTSLLLNSAKLLTNLEGQLAPIIGDFVTAFQRGGPPLANEMRAPFETLARGVFNEATARMESLGESNPDTAVSAAADALAQAYGFGLSSAGVTAAFESLFPEKLNTLNGAAAMIAEMAGFAEVTGKVRDPLYENAFGKSLQYHYRSIFKPELPDEADAVTWHSRGLLSDAQLRTIFNYSGLKAEYEEAFVQSAYRPVSAFIMLRLLESGVIDDKTLRSALQFNGYRAQDQDALIEYAKWAALTSYRNQYVSAVITAAERGVLTTQEVDDSLTAADVPPGANNFVHLTIATRKLEQLAEIYRKSVSEAYQYGLIADADYIPHLAAIGIAEADAAAHYAVDSFKKQGRALLAEERAAAAAQKRLEAAAARAALAEFITGTINEAELTAALIASGMDAGLAGFAVAYAVARKQGTQVLVYGVLKDKAGAQVLRAKVQALAEQATKKLITPDEALAQLESTGIPANVAEPLVAKWAAQALKEKLVV